MAIRLLKSRRSIVETHPEVTAMWDTKKNAPLLPAQFSMGSHYKAWWICDTGHEFEARITKLTHCKLNGCPACWKTSGNTRTSIKNKGSLAELHVEISLEWHPIKNGPLTAKHVAARSSKRVWWKCISGHEWQAPISARTSGSNCPVCYELTRGNILKRSYLKKRGAISLTHPELLKEWDYEKNHKFSPDDYHAGSHQHVWWKCRFGHSSKSEIRVRAKGHKCPDCNAQTSRLEVRILSEIKILVKSVEWRKKHYGKEIDIYLPEYKVALEIDGSVWHQHKKELDLGKNALLEKKRVLVIRIRGDGLPLLGGNDISYKESEQDLQVVKRLFSKLSQINPEIIDPLKLNNYLNGNEYLNDEYYKRILAQLPAPEVEDSFAHNFPHLLSEWSEKNAPLTPEMFSKMSSKRVWWKCSKGHEWVTRVSKRATGRGCPKCARQVGGAKSRSTHARRNSLKVFSPKVAAELHQSLNGDLKASDISCSSKLVVWWKCENGHEWKQSPQSRRAQRGTHECPKCRIDRKLLALTNPNLIAELHPHLNPTLDLSVLTTGSHQKLWWKCSKGHAWEAVVYNRTSEGGSGCPFCARQKK